MNRGFDKEDEFNHIRSTQASSAIFHAASQNDLATLSRILTDLENAIQDREERIIE